MLSYLHADLIQQSNSYEAAHRRDYSPFPQNEQFILDTIVFICVALDTFVCSTILSLAYFPEYVSTIQNASLGILFALQAGKVLGEFLYQLQQHRAFVNTRKQFQVRAWENPNMVYICELVWHNPESFLDFRTHHVRVGQRFIYDNISIPSIPPAQAEPQQQHRYNTRSQGRRMRSED